MRRSPRNPSLAFVKASALSETSRMVSLVKPRSRSRSTRSDAPPPISTMAPSAGTPAAVIISSETVGSCWNQLTASAAFVV
jgi:hypothetical protein